MFNTLKDAATSFVNSGLLEEVNLDFEDEVVSYMYLKDCTLEEALDYNDAWRI